MEQTYRTICQRLTDIADLDEGRRDLGGILSRTAELARDSLGLPFAYAAAGMDSAKLAAISLEGAGPRTEPWSEPGRVAQLVIQTRETREWSIHRRLTCGPSTQASVCEYQVLLRNFPR